MSRAQCEFFFDFGSPTAYLAWTQLPGICTAAGADLVYRPMLLGGVFQATGNASPVSVPAKGKYMLADMARFARRYGVPMRFNPHFPINTLQLMRAAVGVQSRMPERFVDYVTAVYESTWIEARDMGDLRNGCRSAGKRRVRCESDTRPGLRPGGQGGVEEQYGGSRTPGCVWRSDDVRREGDVLRPGPARLRQGSARGEVTCVGLDR